MDARRSILGTTAFCREVKEGSRQGAKAQRSARIFAAIIVICLTAAWASNAPAADTASDSSVTAAKADASSDKTAADSSAEPPESLLGWLHRSLGTRFTLIFLALTFVLVALMVVNVLAVRRDSIAPPGLIQALELRLGDDRFSEACELVRENRSFLSRVLAAGLPQLTAADAKSSTAKATAAMEEFGSLESIKLHARLGYVWLIAQLAPLFGLLGTIDGLIAAFDAIVRKGATPRPIDLAGGFGTALVATAVGLWIAILAVAFHQLVLARMDRLVAEAGILAERFAERFAAARKAGG
jgi:biopolymer transport protein ExbB